jgi:8-amino-7-oxononanoate synthase
MSERDVAIVGMGCRFPKAADLGAYWQNIRDARVCFSEVPADRWDHSLFYDPSPRAIDMTYARKVGLIDDVRAFAAMHYGLAPLRVTVTDPQQRLLLDTVRVALEDAGYTERTLAGSRTGVFVGASVSEYKDNHTSRLRARALAHGQWGRGAARAKEIAEAIVESVTPLRAFSIAGNLLNMIAATVAQTFDFHGPAYTIDAACSSALVATFDAVLALRARVCDTAIAGGVYLNLTPDNLVGFARIGAISPSDACRPFDEKADGFVLGEGVGAVVLKRLADALRDGDRIYAVIRGAGINNDGRGEGPMTPRLEGQLDAIERAHAEVDFTPDTIGYIEAHGTATAVGDATEIGALRRYWDANAKRPVESAISSVKANIGHTMSAAGVAGLIKAAMVLERAELPPQAAFDRPHPTIGLGGDGKVRFRVATEPTPWRNEGPRRAAVSSFGFGGTNCHLVVEQAPPREKRASVAVGAAPQPHAFVVSAPTPALLADHLASIASTVDDRVPLADLARTLARRDRFDARVGFSARTHVELRDRLAAARDVVRGATKPGIWYAAQPLPEAERTIAMLFPGQGAQTLGLCKALYDRFPGFRARLDALAADLDDLLPRPLLSYLYPRPNGVPLDEAAAMRALTATEICQPAMAALGLAMFEFARELGVEPAIVIGHSLGEFVALGASGLLSPRDALRFVARRGRVMAQLALADSGAMAAVQGDRAFVEKHLAGMANVWIANVNHPTQTVISGATDAVLAASARLAGVGATVTKLAVSHAFHSPLLQPAHAPIAELVAQLPVATAARAAISCTAPGAYPADTTRARAIMAAHATSPVDFVGGVRAAVAAGARVLVQALSGTTLLSMARGTLRADGSIHGQAPRAAVSLAGGGDDDGTSFVDALVELAVLGVPVSLAPLAGDDARLAYLPPTPLPTETYWVSKQHAGGTIETDLASRATVAAGDDPKSVAELVAIVAKQADTIRDQAAALARSTISGPSPSPSPSPSPISASSLATAAPPIEVDSLLLDIVAAVSAFPRGELRSSHRLVADLGFDSLMIVEMAGKASDAFPGLKGLPKTLFAGETTIADVAAHVKQTVGAAGAIAHAPLQEASAEPIERYAPSFVARPLPAPPAHAVSPIASPIAILGDARLARELATALGVDTTDDLSRARGAIDLRPLDQGPPRTGSSPDGSDPLGGRACLLALALAKQLDGRATSFAIVHRERDAAVAGFAKALAREWPDARVKAICVGERPIRASQLAAELRGTDPVVEVSYAGGERRIVALAPAPALEPSQRGLERSIASGRGEAEQGAGEPGGALHDGVVAVITGGGRGLGAKIAIELARRCKARIALLGRAPDAADTVAAIVAAGGTATYASCDVRDEAAVARAVDAARRAHGPIELVVHAAGVIADAPIARKDAARFADVFDTKALGWIALERATRRDPLRVALALASWSGRFGNAEQTDYAAANHLVAALAAKWTNGRAIALALPPWDGSAMASTIPAGLRSVMRARGVPFLDDRAGLAAVMAELDARGTSGEIVLGRALAAEYDDRARVRLALDTHPYLADHRIQGTPVLPLAAAADYLAAAAARVAGASVALEALELVDGVRLERDAATTIDVRAQRRGDGPIDLEIELAPGKLAYRARGVVTTGSLTELERPHRLERAPLPLDEFYAKHTFHGPRMRGIVAIDGLDATHIAGTVRAARAGELGPSLTMSIDFGIDPLLVDASFQLAAYFVLVKHRRAGLPLGFDELRVLHPIAPGARVRCLVRLEAERSKADLFVGHIDYRDEAGKLVAQLRGVKGAFKLLDAAAAPAPARNGHANGKTANGANGHSNGTNGTNGHAEIPTASYDIAQFPEVLALRQRIADVESTGLDIPFFNLHERVTNDTTVIGGREVINFSSYNYLGLSGDPAVNRTAIEAIERYGTSVSASRIASGEKPLHRELEQAIAKFLGCEDSIVMVGGHATNVSVIGTIVGPGDLVMHDSLAHDSILGGIKLSGARRRPFPHNDWRALDDALRAVRGGFRRVLIAIEGVYSMDGDIPDLPRFIEVKKRHKALMLVDEAHSLGVLGARGAGVGEHWSVKRSDVELWMGTMSKSLASCGGYIAGSRALVEYLKYSNPGFVYSVGISPPNAASALGALRELVARPELVKQLQARSALFLELCRARGIDTGMSAGSAVVPCIIGDSVRCMLVSQALAQARINVQPIVYPAVEEHLSRLRFFVSARHTEAQLRFTAETLADINATFNRTPTHKPPHVAAPSSAVLNDEV